jgi:hypothetical protein
MGGGEGKGRGGTKEEVTWGGALGGWGGEREGRDSEGGDLDLEDQDGRQPLVLHLVARRRRVQTSLGQWKSMT